MSHITTYSMLSAPVRWSFSHVLMHGLVLFLLLSSVKHCGNQEEENDYGAAIQPPSTRSQSSNESKDEVKSPRDAKSPPGGITNLGNTCYMNATVQQIAQHFSQYFDAKHQGQDSKDRKELAHAGKALIDLINDKETKCVNSDVAQQFFDALKKAGWNKEIGTQEDAAELIGIIANQLNFPKFKLQYSYTRDGYPHEVWGEAEVPIGSPFPVQFPEEKEQDEKSEPKASGHVKLQTMIDRYFSPGAITKHWGDEKNVACQQTPHIASELPETLIIQLVRFKSNRTSGAMEKDKTPVKEIQNIIFKGSYFQPKSAQDQRFQLVGAIRHIGSTLQSGHYTSYVKNGETWFCADDSQVAVVSSDEIDKRLAECYILFYKKIKK